jgi:hypothetical protein
VESTASSFSLSIIVGDSEDSLKIFTWTNFRLGQVLGKWEFDLLKHPTDVYLWFENSFSDIPGKGYGYTRNFRFCSSGHLFR